MSLFSFSFSFWELTFSLSILCFVSVVAKEMTHVSDLFLTKVKDIVFRFITEYIVAREILAPR
jgi:hypothetical protein